MAQAIDDGIPKLRIEEAAARTQARIDSGQQAVIGINKYQVDEDHEIEVHKVENSRVRAEQIDKLQQLRADRDEAAVAAALAELTRAAGADGAAGEDGLGNNLLALAIDAARAKATVGEISDALEKVYGGTRPRSVPSPGSTAMKSERRAIFRPPPNWSRSSPRPMAAGHASWWPRWARTGTTVGRR